MVNELHKSSPQKEFKNRQSVLYNLTTGQSSNDAFNFKSMLKEKLETLHLDKQKFFKDNGFEDEENFNDNFDINLEQHLNTSEDDYLR